MDILTTSLEALLQRATNPQNENVDKAAVEAFCALVNKENEGSHIAIRLLASKIHAQHEREALQTLGVLDSCMKKCGPSFQSEVGKFRFLNEMIKLVSPKYLGSQTPALVRMKVLQLLQVWTEDYPRETKIKEAYDMLKKQGVVIEIPAQKPAEHFPPRPQKTNSIFDNDERSRLLQKLLQSKNPDDLQAANRLIKTMVKEDDKRAELVSKRVIELEAVHNNIRLLNEMLDNYRPGHSSIDEVDLIKELYQSCERLRPNVYRLATETQQNEEMLREVLQASDELGQVFDKYVAIIVRGGAPPSRTSSDGDSLLDLGSPNEAQTPSLLDNASVINNNQKKKSENTSTSNVDALSDIFSTSVLSTPNNLLDATILQPVAVPQPTTSIGNNLPPSDSEQSNSKLKALEDLDVLGETLLKENLSGTSSRLGPSFNRTSDKIPMNLLSKQIVSEPPPAPVTKPQSAHPTGDVASGLDLTFLIGKPEKKTSLPPEVPNSNGDDCMVDLSDDKCLSVPPVSDQKILPSVTQIKDTPKESPPAPQDNKTQKLEIKPMTDLSVTLESVKPSSIPPLTVLEEKNGVTVVLHFAKDKPREDVQVIVVTTLSKNTSPLSNYHFQAVVPKTSKIKLQPPSGLELPAHNPFLPPSAITQIMLLANPNNEKVSLKFMISYTMGDEMCTEMGEVDSVPSMA